MLRSTPVKIGMTVFKHKLIQNIHLSTATSGVQMVMLVRSGKEYFTDFIEREAKSQKLRLVVNGSFIDLSATASFKVKVFGGPLTANESLTLGRVIQDGRLLDGTEEEGKFYFSQNDYGAEKFSAGSGVAPASSCSAIGGLAPIIVDGLAYGAQNLYKLGVPDDAPLTGDVSSTHAPHLVQKSNAMFKDILARGLTVGKTAIGYNNLKKSLLVVSQAHGVEGISAERVQQLFTGHGADSAVFLDCSDSATLYFDGEFKVSPGKDKNEFLKVAVGFK